MTSVPPIPEEKTPDREVANFVAHGLLADDLIAQSQLNDILRGLANGTLKATDWRRIAENALDLEARRGRTAA